MSYSNFSYALCILQTQLQMLADALKSKIEIDLRYKLFN